MNALMPMQLTKKERKALERELNIQTAKNVKNLSLNLQALVLWNLHQQCGFGKKRLLEFQKAFLPAIEELQKFYMVEDADETEFVLLYKLKNEVGIDVRELNEMFKMQVKITD